MKELVSLAAKMLIGGSFVVFFAPLSEILKPKRFAGFFSAAPSVALGSLLVTALTLGPQAARPDTLGMPAGSVALVAFCLVVPAPAVSAQPSKCR